jgi:hypothetical protein
VKADVTLVSGLEAGVVVGGLSGQARVVHVSLVGQKDQTDWPALSTRSIRVFKGPSVSIVPNIKKSVVAFDILNLPAFPTCNICDGLVAAPITTFPAVPCKIKF